ncbi:MAG: class E sortase [Pseudonocardiaceae bacterium]
MTEVPRYRLARVAPGHAAPQQERHRVNHRRAQRVDRPRPQEADPKPSSPEYRLLGQVLVIVAVLGLSFLAELTLLGNLRHDRDQAQLTEQFRSELANGIAPIGPVDDNNAALALGAPMGLLEIPRLGLREVVVQGTSSVPLMSGPGHRRDTPFPGQVGTSVIAGRRATYGGPFRSIDQLRAGDQITVTTGQGKNTFAVLGVRRAGNLVPPALTSGQGRLTLVTTDGSPLWPTNVLRVDANLTRFAQARPAPLPSQALLAAEAVMAGDRAALLGVFLWSMLFALVAIGTVWLRFRAGALPAWLIGVPVLISIDLVLVDQVAALLPNIL